MCLKTRKKFGLRFWYEKKWITNLAIFAPGLETNECPSGTEWIAIFVHETFGFQNRKQEKINFFLSGCRDMGMG